MKKYILFFTLILFVSGAYSANSSLNLTPSSDFQKTNFPEAIGVNHSKWSVLLKKHVSNKGIVNYKGFQKDAKELNSYLEILAKNTPQKSWSKNAVLAYWINVYNAFTVKLIVDNYPVKSIKDIPNPWSTNFIELGNKKYTLEQIENEILRKMNEPRIHFAINCASYSCPNLLNQAFNEATLDKQLTQVTKSFLADKSKNTITSDSIQISKIFDWFSADFITKGTVIDFLNQYTTVKINAKAKIIYKDYNWNLNE